MARRFVVLLVGAIALGPAVSPACAEPPAARTDLLGDPLPPGALARIGTLRFRHAGAVISASYAPDGKSIAGGGRDGTVLIWDVQTGKQLLRIGPSAAGAAAADEAPDGLTSLTVAYSPDTKRLATTGSGKTVVVRDAATGKELLTLEGHESTVAAVAFAPDGKTLFSMDVTTAVRAWDAVAGKEKFAIPGRKTRVVAFALAPDGRTVAVGGEGNVCLWDDTGAQRACFKNLGWVHSLAFSPDGKTLAVGDRGGNVHLWDLAAGRERTVLKPGTHGHADSLAFRPDGTALAMGSDCDVVVWDLASGKATVLDLGRVNTRQTTVTYSPDGKTLAVASDDKALRFWDAVTLREKPSAPGHTAPVRALAIAPDGKTVVTGADDKSVRFWDAATGRETTGARGQTIFTGCLAFSPDGSRLLAGGSSSGLWSDPSVRLWDASTGAELLRFRGHQYAVRRVLFAADGKTFLTGGSEGDVAVWDAATGREVRRFKRLARGVLDVALSADGGVLAVGGYANVPGLGEHTEGLVRLLDAATGKERATLWAYDQAVHCVAFTRDGRAAVSIGYLDPVLLWDLVTGRPRLRLADGSRDARRAAVSPDGRLLALGCRDGSMRVYDLLTGRERRRFEGHVGGVEALAFSPDGRVLVSGGSDTTALVWDMTALPAPPRTVAPDAAELAALWADLADDPAKAYQAIGRLAVAPKEAGPFLGERVRPAALPEAAAVARLLADLDNDSFDERERATAELRRLGDLAAPALRQFLRGQPGTEGRRRAGDIVGDLDRDLPPREQLRELRAVEALEWAGAADVLRKIAAGAPEARLTREAKAALGRMAR
jgi:WD40 repeat protein